MTMRISNECFIQKQDLKRSADHHQQVGPGHPIYCCHGNHCDQAI